MKLALLIALCFLALAEDSFTTLRNKMVDSQIVARGISDPATVRAMRKVPRHLLVPPDKVSAAYDDGPLPIGFGQTISQPYIVALMTELSRPKPEHGVLEIGTGSGYQAAVLSEIVKEVFTIEIVPELGNQGKERLQKLGCKNVTVKIADGYYGWKEKAPFDAIIVTAAAEHIPPPLIEQLKEGGRMVIPVGHAFFVQNLVLVEKQKGGKITSRNIIPVAFVPFQREKK